MTFDATISLGNVITLIGFGVTAIVGWTRIEFMQKSASERLREVSFRYDEEAKLTLTHRLDVTKALHETAMLNQETAITLRSVSKDVERLSKELNEVRSRRYEKT